MITAKGERDQECGWRHRITDVPGILFYPGQGGPSSDRAEVAVTFPGSYARANAAYTWHRIAGVNRGAVALPSWLAWLLWLLRDAIGASSYGRLDSTSPFHGARQSWARAYLWKQWKHRRRRYRALRKLKVRHELAAKLAGSGRGAWRLSLSPALCYALPNALFAQLGLVQLAPEPNR